MNNSEKEYINNLIEKYQKYIKNLQWHVDNNLNGFTTPDIDLQLCIYKILIADLIKILP